MNTSALAKETMTSFETVAVLGAGSWGSALAKALSDAGHRVTIWARRKELSDEINRTRTSERYLKGFAFNGNLTATSDIHEVFHGATAVLSAIPTPGLRETLSVARTLFPPTGPVLSATKGIENDSLKLVSGIFEEYVDDDSRLTYLGGPSFANEVAAGMPTAVVVAGVDARQREHVQQMFATEKLRVYTTDDVAGVEVGGALKNVIAIAAGMSDGLGFGSNSRAALITRGLAEISRLAVKLGAHPLTLSGLGGMGDLVLTCTGDLSRNRRVGLELGKGKTIDQVLAGMNQVAEGVRTTKSAFELSQRENVDMPIVRGVYRILYQGASPQEMLAELMTRPPREERDS